MKQKKTAIDFKKMEWSRVDRQKAEFFYNEAVGYNDTLIVNINNLNGKAFSLLAMALSVLAAAVGFLLAVWEKEHNTPLTLVLSVASAGMAVTAALLLLAVFPRRVYLSRGTPASFFTGNFYKADMLHQLSFGIASLNTFITHNHAVEHFRSRFLLAGSLSFFATPIVTFAAFLICLPSW